MDHVYTRGFPESSSRVLQEKTTDHQPGITLIQTGGGCKPLTKLRRRNFKSICQDALEEALNIHDWAGIFSLKDMDEVHRYIVRGIVEALNVVAPIEEIVVKTGSNIYLTQETLKMMKRRDTAKVGSPRFRTLQILQTTSSSATNSPQTLRP
jgi:hypothetical protein